jgi:hypothetical protein
MKNKGCDARFHRARDFELWTKVSSRLDQRVGVQNLADCSAIFAAAENKLSNLRDKWMGTAPKRAIILRP